MNRIIRRASFGALFNSGRQVLYFPLCIMAYEMGEYMQKKYDEKGYTIKDKSLIIHLHNFE